MTASEAAADKALADIRQRVAAPARLLWVKTMAMVRRRRKGAFL
ncbi:MAG: hypothetical protein WBE48_11285 [Xanthobacteraceae bacterium]|jgi:hypothetical protein